MGILKNRPLFCVCLLYIICAFCAYFASPAAKIVLLCISAAALLGCSTWMLLKRSRHRTLLLAAACSLCAALAIGSSVIAYGAALQKYETIAARKTCTVEATVLERQSSDTMSVYRVRVHSIDEESYRFDATLVCDFTSYLQAGDTFSATVAPSTLRDAASPYYNTSYALADGLRMQLDCKDESEILSVSVGKTLPIVSLSSLNDTLCRALLNVCGEESGGLICALLLGDRGYLQGTLTRDFERAGASHMLALSGLHVSILMGAVGFLLAKLHLHRKARAVLLSLSAVGYLLLTGMSISATRAVVMVCVLQLSYLLAADHDTLTTLGLVGAGILLLDPYSVSDTGFILSFLATFGIVVLVPPLHDYLQKRKESLCKPPHRKAKTRVLGIAFAVLETLLIGVIACFSIFVPSCFLLGDMSLFSPLTTLLLSPVVALLLVLGTITLLLCPIPPLANFFATLIRLVYAISMPYVERVSAVDGALLPLNHTATQMLGIVCCSSMLLLLLLPLRKKWLLSLPPVLLALGLCIFFPIHQAREVRDLRAAYTHPSAISETLVSAEGYRAYICDLSSGTGTAMRAAMHAAQELHATEIGAILLTDYHTQQGAMLTDLLCSYKTDTLYLPVTDDADDLTMQKHLCAVASAYGVQVVTYEYGTGVEWQNGATLTVHRTDLSRSEQPALVITMQKGEAQITVLSASAPHTALATETEHALSEADAVVIPERGPKPKLTYSLSAADGAKVIFATRALASYCDPNSLSGVRSMTVCPEIAYFTIATGHEK